jgi:hypothetical protein
MPLRIYWSRYWNFRWSPAEFEPYSIRSALTHVDVILNSYVWKSERAGVAVADFIRVMVTVRAGSWSKSDLNLSTSAYVQLLILDLWAFHSTVNPHYWEHFWTYKKLNTMTKIHCLNARYRKRVNIRILLLFLFLTWDFCPITNRGIPHRASQWHAALGRTTMGKWSALRINLYLKNTTLQRDMHP